MDGNKISKKEGIMFCYVLVEGDKIEEKGVI